MKKLMFLLLALPMMLVMASCDSDDNLPEVTFGFDYSNATTVDGVFYVVKGDTLKIDSVYVTPKEGTKQAEVLSVLYRFNGWVIANTPIPPFAIAVPTDSLDAGRYLLGMECPVVQVGKTPATAYVVNEIQVVDNVSDIPAVSPTPEGTVRIQPDMKQR